MAAPVKRAAIILHVVLNGLLCKWLPMGALFPGDRLSGAFARSGLAVTFASTLARAKGALEEGDELIQETLWISWMSDMGRLHVMGRA